MKKVKYLLIALFVSMLALTGCGKKNELSAEDTIKKAAENMQKLENYKMHMEFNIGIGASGFTMDMGAEYDAIYDVKNNTAKMDMTVMALGQTTKTQSYMDLEAKDGKIIVYSKSQDDDEWVKSITDSKEGNPNVTDSFIKTLSSDNKIKELKSDKDNYNYELTISGDAFKELMTSMNDTSDVLGDLDVDSLKGNIVLTVSIDKKTNNYTKISMDMKDLLNSYLSESQDSVQMELSKAEFVITYSDFDDAGDVEIPSDVIKNAQDSYYLDDDSDDDYDFDDDYDQNLTCKKTTEEEGFAGVATIDIGLNNNVVEVADLEIVLTFEQEEDAKEFYDQAVDSEEYDGVYKFGNIVTIQYQVDTLGETANYNDAKTYFESEGYVCE